MTTYRMLVRLLNELLPGRSPGVRDTHTAAEMLELLGAPSPTISWGSQASARAIATRSARHQTAPGGGGPACRPTRPLEVARGPRETFLFDPRCEESNDRTAFSNAVRVGSTEFRNRLTTPSKRAASAPSRGRALDRAQKAAPTGGQQPRAHAGQRPTIPTGRAGQRPRGEAVSLRRACDRAAAVENSDPFHRHWVFDHIGPRPRLRTRSTSIDRYTLAR